MGLLICFFVVFFVGWGEGGFTALQDYLTHFEPISRKLGRKQEIPEKTPDHPQAELGLSHM